jgi:ArsR family transcriptional regulator, arsenate/arsenite/antimonite-responsive transcriptional repressor
VAARGRGSTFLDRSTNINTINVDMSVLAVVPCCRPLAAPSLTDPDAEATAALFKALGDPARVKVVNLLARSEGPVCACEFVPALGLSQATVSHHLKKLTDAGLLVREQRGKWAYFSIDPEASARLAGLVDFPEVVP